MSKRAAKVTVPQRFGALGPLQSSGLQALPAISWRELGLESLAR
jgi:hypothetical protein